MTTLFYYFSRDGAQIFDAAIVVTSFVLDLVFVEGSAGEEGEQAAAIIMVFLLWRILRIVNGTRTEIQFSLLLYDAVVKSSRSYRLLRASTSRRFD